MNISSTLTPSVGRRTTATKSAVTPQATESLPQDDFQPGSSNPLKAFVQERPVRAAATAFALGVAVPAALGAEFGLGFQGIGNIVSAGALVAMLAGSGTMMDALVNRPDNAGTQARRGLGDMMAGVSVAFVSPGGNPLAAAGIALGTALAVL